MLAFDLLAREFGTLPDLIRIHASERGGKVAVADDAGSITYAELDSGMDRVAAALQQGGVAQGEAVALSAQRRSRWRRCSWVR